MVQMIRRRLFGAVLKDSKGVTSLEYAVLGIFLVLAIAAFLPGFVTKVNDAFTAIGTGL